MPVSGAKPKPDGQAVTRHPKQFEWTEVLNIPYAGVVPVRLPQHTSRVLPFGGVEIVKVDPMTRAWWRSVIRMPHCVLWSESDWQFALATALVADRFHYGHTSSAAELRQRERVLGMTVDARRDLRIRYVEPKPAPDGPDATVTKLADYRSL